MASRQRSPEEAAAVVERLTEARNLLAAEDAAQERKDARVEKFIKWAWGFGVIVFSLAIAYGKLQWDSSNHADKLKEQSLHVDALEKQHVVDALLWVTMQNTMDGNRKERDNIVTSLRDELRRVEATQDDIAPKVREMEFMRSHGITNADEFKRKNGYPPPASTAEK